MLGSLVDAQVSELTASERSPRQHALDRLLDDALRKPAFEQELRGARLDAADVAGVVVIDLLVELAARQHHLFRIDDDDVVAAIDMGRIGRLVLAAQAERDDRGEPADDEAVGIDQHPSFLDLGWLGRIGLHLAWSRISGGRRNARASAASKEPWERRQCTCPGNSHFKTTIYYFGAILPPAGGNRVGRSRMRCKLVIAFRADRDLANGKALAELE